MRAAPPGLVLARNESFLFVCKPSNLHVFPPHAEPAGDCVLARLLRVEPTQARPQDGPAWPPGFEGGLLHRLDSSTSGLVVAARSLASLAAGRAAFASHTLHKHYRFLTAASVPWDSHVVTNALAHHPHDRRKMVWRRGVRTGHRGRWYEAETRLQRVHGEGRRSDYPLWEAVISTGVMHQVRLHAASVGLPILGDRLYGGAPAPDGGADRFYLHHRRIDGWPGAAPEIPEPDDWP